MGAILSGLKVRLSLKYDGRSRTNNWARTTLSCPVISYFSDFFSLSAIKVYSVVALVRDFKGKPQTHSSVAHHHFHMPHLT